MKNFNLILISLLGLMIFLSSCGDEKEMEITPEPSAKATVKEIGNKEGLFIDINLFDIFNNGDYENAYWNILNLEVIGKDNKSKFQLTDKFNGKNIPVTVNAEDLNQIGQEISSSLPLPRQYAYSLDIIVINLNEETDTIRNVEMTIID